MPRTHVIIQTSILILGIAACSNDNVSGVRLVKDNDHTFHFQWDKPLKEERIILVRNTRVFSHYDERQLHWVHHKPPSESEIFVYFPAGSFVSAPVRSSTYGSRWQDRILSVEILPARLRNTVDFPANLYRIRHGEFWAYLHDDMIVLDPPFHVYNYYQVILRDHPFQEYRIDEPSRLEFTVD